MAQQVSIKNLNELESFAERLVSQFQAPLLLLLSGEMGAGKTAFTKMIVKALGGGEAASPTFAIHHQYESAKGLIDHYDLYRLKDAQDLESSGLLDRLQSAQGLVVIEWSDRLDEDFWPPPWSQIKIHFVKNDDGSRTIEHSEKV